MPLKTIGCSRDLFGTLPLDIRFRGGTGEGTGTGTGTGTEITGLFALVLGIYSACLSPGVRYSCATEKHQSIIPNLAIITV